MTHTSLPRGLFPLPSGAVGAEGEAPGGAVTNGTNPLSELLPAATLRNKSAPSEEVLIFKRNELSQRSGLPSTQAKAA